MAPNNLNLNQAQVIDPILTTQARGYINAATIFAALFPQVPVPQRAMKVLKFGKESFRIMNTRRAPGASTKVVTYGFESDPIALVQDALNAIVPREIAQAAQLPGVDMESKSINMVLNVVDLGHEKLAADLATNPANYAPGNTLAVAGTDKWTDPNSDPFTQVEDGKLTVAAKIGVEPNTLVIGREVFGALRKHPKIKDQFKYTGRESVTVEMLAAYFDIEQVVVGRAVYLPTDAPDDTPANFIWGNAAMLSYVNRDGTYMAPSYGYTYRLDGYPIVEQPYWDNDRKSWIYGVTQERAPVVTGMDAGFLIENPI